MRAKLHLGFRRPEAFLDLLDRTVRAINEHEVKARRHDLVDPLIAQDKLHRTEAYAQRALGATATSGVRCHTVASRVVRRQRAPSDRRTAGAKHWRRTQSRRSAQLVE